MPGRAGNIKLLLYILWLLLQLRHSCSSLDSLGPDHAVQCLRDVLRSVVDPEGILKSSWNFDDRNYDRYMCRFIGVECAYTDVDSILALRLGNLGLEGQFPRGLQNCRGLNVLDLSGNKLSGPIPSDISRQMPFLASLNLSYNSFAGEIPVDIKNMAYLHTLKLQGNQLSGQIPEGQFSLWLESFSVADNQLSGPIPSTLRKFGASSFTGNPELCGEPLDDCSKRKWRLPRINDESSIGAAAGFVVGVAVAFYFPHLFICSRKLQPYIVRVC